MTSTSRRRFLQTVAQSGAAAAAMTVLPESIRNALAIPANSRTGTIRDVEHIVVFMQENRSFDHYFGHLRGVRGYNDRLPIPLPGGLPVWYQPSKADATKPVLPFHLDTFKTSAQCVGDLDHAWYPTHYAINNGLYNQWPQYKTDMTMGYYLRADIPFHYALADAFTVWSSGPRELPPQALTDPYVNLSIHTAPLVRRSAKQKSQCANNCGRLSRHRWSHAQDRRLCPLSRLYLFRAHPPSRKSILTRNRFSGAG